MFVLEVAECVFLFVFALVVFMLCRVLTLLELIHLPNVYFVFFRGYYLGII